MEIKKTKIIALAVALIMALVGLTACSGGNNDAKDTVNDVLSGYNDPSAVNTPSGGNNSGGNDNQSGGDDSIAHMGGTKGNVVYNMSGYAVDGSMGNTSGNLANEGFAAFSGDRVYYTGIFNNDYRDLRVLYSVKTDGSDKLMLDTSGATDINISGDRIYYIRTHDTTIYSMKTDGTDKCALTEGRSHHLVVANGRIYYHNGNDDGKLYTMMLDGSDNRVLVDDRATYITVVGDDVYYLNDDESNRLYAIKADGTNRRLVIDNSRIREFQIVNGMIYWRQDSGQIVNSTTVALAEEGKSNIAGNTTTAVDRHASGGVVPSFNVCGDRIYYIYRNDSMDYYGSIYSVKLDGTDRVLISDDTVKDDYLIVIGDRIHYINYEDDRIYAVKTDGSGDKQLVE